MVRLSLFGLFSPFPQCLTQPNIPNHTFDRPLTGQEQNQLYESIINGRLCLPFTKHGIKVIVSECANQPVIQIVKDIFSIVRDFLILYIAI